MKRYKEKCFKILAYKYAYYGARRVLVLCALKYCVVNSRFGLLPYLDILKNEFKVDRFSIHKVNVKKITSIGAWDL